MAWLRDLMNQAKPPVRSYDALAESALDHPEWPRDQPARPRSLAALFSKLDRGLDMEWLSHRPAVQQVLAATLSCPLSSITVHLERGVETSYAEQHRFRFDDARFARPIDLRQEPLPPGIPPQLSDPKRWDRLWWVAPSGSGRSLTGRWLQSRGLARFVTASSGQEAAGLVQQFDGEPLFVELYRAEQGLDALHVVMSAHICVAAPCPPPSPAWTRLESPRREAFLAPLLDWLALRLPDDGHFDATAARAWLTDTASSEVLDTFGAVIGLAGLIDEVGIGAIRNKSLEALASWFLALRLKQAAAEGNPDAHWLARHGLRALTGLARQALTDSEQPWTAPRSHDAWIALVPPELQRGVDADWVRLSLSKSGQSSRRDLERALRDLPPGAFGVIRALLAARILRPSPDADALSVSPHWLSSSALDVAIDELCNESPFEWGEALLSSHGAPLILRRLIELVSLGDETTIEKTLELGARENPASAVAIEACFRAAGIALLAGNELPPEVLEPLYREGLTLLIELPGKLPEARLLHPAPAAPSSARGVLYLAAWAISEQIVDQPSLDHPLLNPWREESPDARLAQLLDEVERCFDGEAGAALEKMIAKRTLYSLVDRLSQHFRERRITQHKPDGSVFRHPDGSIHPLELPSVVLHAFTSNALDREMLDLLPQSPTALLALELLCAERRIAWSEVARALWSTWTAHGPLDSTFLRFSAEHGERLWPHAPKEVFEKLGTLGAEPLPFAHLRSEQWPWVPSEYFEGATPWTFVPVGFALEKIEAGELLPPSLGLEALWRRAPEKLGAIVTKSFEPTQNPDTSRLELAFTILRAAPTREASKMLAALGAFISHPGVAVRWVDETRQWLLQCIKSRAPEWRSAYTVLADLERRLRRVTQRR